VAVLDKVKLGRERLGVVVVLEFIVLGSGNILQFRP
jgi:hypothetical protein